MARFGVKEVANVTFYNLVTGKPELYLDTLKLSNLENTAESVYATGGQGSPRLVGWDFSRTANFNVQDALLNPKAIAMQTGNELKKQIETIHAREVKAVVDNLETPEVTVDFTPIDTTKVFVYKTTNGIEQGDEVTGVTVEGNVITGTGLVAGEQVIVYYTYQTEQAVETITISSDKFGGFYRVVGDTLWRNEQTGADEAVQIVIPKAKIMSAFTLTMQPDGDPSVFDFNLDVFKDGTSTDMIKIIHY